MKALHHELSNDVVSSLSIPYNLTFLADGIEVAWTNQPAALTEFLGASRYRTFFDLRWCAIMRLIVNVVAVGASGAELRVQYSTDLATWYYLDNVSGPKVNIGSTGLKVSPWIALDAGAKAEVYLRIVGINGDGVKDPKFGLIALQILSGVPP